MTAKRIARLLSWAALIVCVISLTAVIYRVRTFEAVTGTGSVGIGFYYFMALPFGFPIATVLVSRGTRMGPMWICAGGMFACAIAGLFSVGRFLIPTALLLFAAATANCAAVRSRWWTLTFPVWFAVGLFTVPVLFLAASICQRLSGQAVVFPGETREFDSPASITTVAPFEIVGSWFFVAAVVALTAVYLAVFFWRRIAGRKVLAAAAVVGVLLAGATITSLTINRGRRQLSRGNASGCESSGARTRCWSQ